MALITSGVKVIGHKRLPFVLHLRLQGPVPIIAVAVANDSVTGAARVKVLKNRGFVRMEPSVDQSLGIFSDGDIKARGFVDLDQGCSIFLKFLEPTLNESTVQGAQGLHGGRTRQVKAVIADLYQEILPGGSQRLVQGM